MTLTARHSIAGRLAWLMLALAAAFLPATRPASAQAAPAPEYRRLGLNADQMTRVRELHKDTGQKMRGLERQLREQRRALEVVYGEYDLDATRVRQLNARINEIQRAILDQHLNLQTDLRKILTAEQFGRLKAIMEERRTRARERLKPKTP